jgi:predicted acylesterase/phospholipase RssA
LVQIGCTTVLVRAPVPAERSGETRPYGIEGTLLRVWGDSLGEAKAHYLIDARVATLRTKQDAAIPAGTRIRTTMLALSGGGGDGAFGAGLPAGWTERGDRPEFEIVSGVSTGAIIGIFAFLGPEYDTVLRDINTNYATRDLLTSALLSGLLHGAAVADTAGFRRLIDFYIDDTVVESLAEAREAGRILLIGMTNLDAARPVVWNLGAIAASGDPIAKALIRDVIRAFAAIPGAFPPVLIPVEANGRVFDEMHVDGGATRQVLLFSPELRLRRIDEALDVEIHRRLFVIVNNRLQRPYAPAPPWLRPITGAAISSLIAGAGTGDVVQLYTIAEREEMPICIVSIPPDFDLVSTEPFDRDYMRALYVFGYETGRDGVPWSRQPPGFPDLVRQPAAASSPPR